MPATTSPLRFGIAGCGAIGPTHARAILELGHRVVALADPVESRARKLLDEIGSDARIHRDHAALASDDNVDAVAVCTPSGMHADHAVAALLAGKHVIVEKPMDVTIEACDRLIAAADRAGRHCGVISQHRFDAATVLARQLIDQGRIGRILLITGDVKWYRTQAYYDEGEWRGTWKLDGGGALMNQGIHTLDLLHWLGGGVASVHARASIAAAHERIEVEDSIVLSLSFRNGAIGSLVASTAAYDGFPVRIEVYGTEGSILLEGDNLKRVALRSGETFQTHEAAEHAISVARGGTASAGRRTDPSTIAPVGAKWGDAHRAQIADFVAAIRENRPPMIDARAGRDPVAIVAAAYASARSRSDCTVAP